MLDNSLCVKFYEWIKTGLMKAGEQIHGKRQLRKEQGGYKNMANVELRNILRVPNNHSNIIF